MHFAVWSRKPAAVGAAACVCSKGRLAGVVAHGPTPNVSQSCKCASRRFSKIDQGRPFRRGRRIPGAPPRTSGIASYQELDSRRYRQGRDRLSTQGKRIAARPALMEEGDAVKATCAGQRTQTTCCAASAWTSNPRTTEEDPLCVDTVCLFGGRGVLMPARR